MPFKNRTPSLKNFMIRGSSGSAREIKNVAIVKIRKSDDFLGVRQINLARQLHIAPKITAKKPEITDFFVFLNCVVLTIASKFALLTIKGFSGAPVKTRTRISSSEDCCVIHYTTRAGCKISEFLEREHSNPRTVSPKTVVLSITPQEQIFHGYFIITPPFLSNLWFYLNQLFFLFGFSTPYSDFLFQFCSFACFPFCLLDFFLF